MSDPTPTAPAPAEPPVAEPVSPVVPVPVSLSPTRRLSGLEHPKPIVVDDPVTITVDGVAHTAQKGDLLIDALERAGTYVPRFCYHPRMTPVGMCRMCLVEVDGPRGPSLQPSCMVPVGPDMVVNTATPGVEKAQDGVLEFLLANHPLDCPVCDKGGECPLQDQTLAYGPGESRFVEEKRHYEKPIAISDTVYLDRERCILCDRCTRFAREVAGDPLIHFTERGSGTQVLTFPDEPFASYFSGNTVQICPVGALTASPYRFKARPWDLEQAESTCTTCSVGCRITAQSTRNRVVRYLGIDSDPVNQGWLCDRGRFGFEATDSDHRVRRPAVSDGGERREARWSEALDAAADILRRQLAAGGPQSVAVLGGARLTNESAYAWAKLAKGVLGVDNTDAQLGDGLPAEAVLGLPPATIDDLCAPGTTVLWMAGDPKEELPVLFLRLRGAVKGAGVRLLAVGTTGHDSLSDLAATRRVAAPGGLVEAVTDLLSEAGDKLCVVVGRRTPSEPAGVTLDAVAAVRSARPDATFLSALPRGNVRGALDAGLAPGLLPGRRTLEEGRAAFAGAWPTLPEARGAGYEGIIAGAAEGRIGTIVLLGCDPVADGVDPELAVAALGRARVISLETLPNSSSPYADVVLPVTGHGETAGTTTNLEGRVSLLNTVVTPTGTARADWQIADALAVRLGGDLGLTSVADIGAEMAALMHTHADITPHHLSDPAVADGLCATGGEIEWTPPAGPTEVPPISRYSLALVLSRRLYRPGTMLAACPSSAQLSAPEPARLHPADFDKVGVATGDSVTLVARTGSARVSIVPDPSVPRGHVEAALGLSGDGLMGLIDPSEGRCEVRIESGLAPPERPVPGELAEPAGRAEDATPGEGLAPGESPAGVSPAGESPAEESPGGEGGGR